MISVAAPDPPLGRAKPIMEPKPRAEMVSIPRKWVCRTTPKEQAPAEHPAPDMAEAVDSAEKAEMVRRRDAAEAADMVRQVTEGTEIPKELLRVPVVVMAALVQEAADLTMLTARATEATALL